MILSQGGPINWKTFNKTDQKCFLIHDGSLEASYLIDKQGLGQGNEAVCRIEINFRLESKIFGI